MSDDDQVERDKHVIFFRSEGWYPVRLHFGRHEIPDHIELNPGTIRVESLDGEILWRPQ